MRAFLTEAGAMRGGIAPRFRARIMGGLAIACTAAIAIAATTALPAHKGPIAHHAAGEVLPAMLASAAAVSPGHVEAEPGTRRFSGLVGTNLTQSLLAAGVPESQGREYVALLGRAIELRNGLTIADKFDLIIERQPSGRYGQLLYAGLDRVARSDVALMKWTDGHSTIWVNAEGTGREETSRMGLPLRGRITSGFGRRFHPILGYERFHAGVDLAAAAGTPIHAAADGRVLQAGWHGGYGQEVELAHTGGIETRYGHMSRIAASIGEVVHKGQVIGWVGSTGLSTGPHVHFEVMRNGRAVNPLSVRMDSGPAQLEGEKLHQFDDALRGLLLASPGRG